MNGRSVHSILVVLVKNMYRNCFGPSHRIGHKKTHSTSLGIMWKYGKSHVHLPRYQHGSCCCWVNLLEYKNAPAGCLPSSIFRVYLLSALMNLSLNKVQQIWKQCCICAHLASALRRGMENWNHKDGASALLHLRGTRTSNLYLGGSDTDILMLEG